jgi:hypothetical protein
VIAIEEGIVDIPQFNIYFTFTGHYLFHDEALTSLKTWFAQASDDPLFLACNAASVFPPTRLSKSMGSHKRCPTFGREPPMEDRDAHS